MLPMFRFSILLIILVLLGVSIYYVILRRPMRLSGIRLRSSLMDAARRRHSGVAHKGFMTILWGLLFLFLDIRIKTIDVILPDFIGYILIAVGLGRLSPLSPVFSKAKVFAVILIFLSLTSLVEFKWTIPQHVDNEYWSENLLSGESTVPSGGTGDSSSILRVANPTMMALAAAGLILDMLMIWHICGGIIGLSITDNNHDLAAAASIRRKLYLIFSIVVLCILMPLIVAIRASSGLISPDFLGILLVPIVVFGILVMVLMMLLVKRAALEIDGRCGNQTDNMIAN